MRILMFNRVRQASKNLRFNCLFLYFRRKNILFIEIVKINGYYILSCLSSHKIWRIKFGQKLTKIDSVARKTVLEFEKELQLNTKLNSMNFNQTKNKC